MGVVEVGQELGFGRSEVEELLDLYRNMPLLELGAEADRLRSERHPQGHVTEAEAHRRLGGWDA